MANIATFRGPLHLLITIKTFIAVVFAMYEVTVQEGSVFVSNNDYADGAESVHVVEGPVEFDKSSANAIKAGVRVYWDDTAKGITEVLTSNTAAGYMIEDAAAGDAVALVFLQPN